MINLRLNSLWFGYILASVFLFNWFGVQSWAQQSVLHPIQVVEAPFGVLTATGIDGSTDGRYLYITDQDDQSLVVLARDPASSELQFVEVQSGFGGTPFAVALSPDDAYVYVTWSDFGYPESGITIFTRNQETGRLTRSGGNRLTGRSLYEPVDIAISSDGNGAYVAANGNDEIAIFQRNATTGALTYRESLLNNQNGLNRLENPRSLVISPDNAYIYVASFGNSTINVFARNVDTNALTLVEMQSESVTGVTGLGELQAISISNDGTQIYVVSNASALTVFQRNAVTGKLTFQQQFRDGKAGVRGLVGRKTVNISQDDTNVYVYSKGYTSPIAQTAVVRFQRNLTTGALTFTNVYTATESAMISSHTQQLEIFLPADGRQLYTSHVDGMDRLDRDPNNGTLFRQPTVMLAFPIPRAPTLDPYSLTTPALSPDGRHLYVPGWGESIASARDDTLSVFQRDATTGEVTPIQVIRDTERSYPLHSAVAAIVSPDGQFVYATGYWGKITRYARNSTTGMLTYLNVYDYTNRTPSLIGFNQLLISPDGKHLYVALSRYSSNDWEAAIGVFTRDLITGALKLVEVKQTNLSPVADSDGVSGLTISPDGKHVYATNYLGNSLTVLQRDPDTGRLTLVTAYYDNANGMDGLDGAAGVTVSADGAYVYVVGGFDKSITLLSRDPTTGVLTLIKTYHTGIMMHSLRLSPNGAWLYTAGWGYLVPTEPQYGRQSALTVFSRNRQNGKLTFVELHEDEVNGITTMNGVSGLEISPDGRFVYLTSSFDDTLMVFARQMPVITPIPTVPTIVPPTTTPTATATIVTPVPTLPEVPTPTTTMTVSATTATATPTTAETPTPTTTATNIATATTVTATPTATIVTPVPTLPEVPTPTTTVTISATMVTATPTATATGIATIATIMATPTATLAVTAQSPTATTTEIPTVTAAATEIAIAPEPTVSATLAPTVTATMTATEVAIPTLPTLTATLTVNSPTIPTAIATATMTPSAPVVDPMPYHFFLPGIHQ